MADFKSPLEKEKANFAEAKRIRSRLRAGATFRELGAEAGVSFSEIRRRLVRFFPDWKGKPGPRGPRK